MLELASLRERRTVTDIRVGPVQGRRLALLELTALQMEVRTDLEGRRRIEKWGLLNFKFYPGSTLGELLQSRAATQPPVRPSCAAVAPIRMQ